MKKPVGPKKVTRQRHSDEFKNEALKLAENVGVPTAAKQLGLHESQLYGWRSKAGQRQGENEQHQQLLAENAKLKRQLSEQAEELAILKKAAAYFAKNQR